MILVVGGTGRLGSSVVATLLADGHEVRVLARGRRPPPAGITGAQWIPGSVTDSGVVARAVHGVDVVITAFTGFPSASPARVDNEGTGAVVRAARRVGARMVFLSVAGAAADAPLELFRAKYAAESAVKSSDLEWTIIRPDAFADLWIELLTQSISGPQRLTLTELASHVMAAQHWPGTPRYVPTAMLRAASMLPGAPGRQAQAALAMETLPPVVDDARRAVPQLPCTTVQALLTTAPAEPV
jgi:uncharacterized protein YbjT (DUF2867 family)